MKKINKTKYILRFVLLSSFIKTFINVAPYTVYNMAQ